jgi:hypothetical protein
MAWGGVQRVPNWARVLVALVAVVAIIAAVAALQDDDPRGDVASRPDGTSSTTTTTTRFDEPGTITSSADTSQPGATTSAPGATSQPGTGATTVTTKRATTSPPTAAPAKRFNGRGDSRTPPFDLVGGMTIFRSTHQGTELFVLRLFDSKGQQIRVLANQTGKYDGSIGVGAPAGAFTIEITADGPWSITVEQPRPTSGEALPAATEQRGQQVVGAFAGGGDVRFTFTHDGQSIFTVTLFDNEGNATAILVSETGAYDNSVVASAPPIFYLVVDADGSWSAAMSSA